MPSKLKQKNSNRPQVLIVGAGPTGLAAALELKRYGIHARIIDKASGLDLHSGALNINSRSLEIFEPSGLTPKLLAHGNRLRRTYLVENGSTIITTHIEALKHRYPFTLILSQAETEKLLLEAVTELGIAIDWNTELMQLDFVGECATAVLATAKEVEYVTPYYLIAADGAHSTVRQCADIGLAGKPYPMVFALADIRYQMLRDPSSATVELLPGGAVASFPIDAHTMRHIGTSHDAVSLVSQRRTGNKTLWKAEFYVNLCHARQLSRGNIYLAGDAAHVSSPIGARGMNLGFEDAAWLAWLISKGEAADQYSKERLPVAKRVNHFTRRQTDQLCKTTGAIQNFSRRYLAASLLALPFVEQSAIRNLVGLDTPHPPWLDGMHA